MSDGTRGRGSFGLAVLAVVLGAFAGLGAYTFRVFIAVVHNLMFLGELSMHYDTDFHTPPSPWGVAVALSPVAGAVVVTYLVRRFAPEAKGHGVPEVIDAIYYGGSVIRPVVGAIKSVASAISIGTGGSVGREGPIIQIGASFASIFGELAQVSRWQRATLVAAGGGAGIAATFNTPLGGVLFAVEVLMPEISVRTLTPVALATTTATYVARFLFGNKPAFFVPEIGVSVVQSAELLPLVIVLGLFLGLLSVVFIRSLYGTEDIIERWSRGHPYLRHGGAMLLVGIIFTAVLLFTGRYYVQGVGYATIIDVLSNRLTSIWFLLVLALLKLASTCLTLGSGGSGGIFSPSLFLGATLGAAFGLAAQSLIPSLNAGPAIFALAGMAAVVAGATGAVLTAVVMIFEMSLDYAVVLPLTFSAAVSYGLRRIILADTIYTMKLTRRGHVTPQALQANVGVVQQVADIALTNVKVLHASTTASALRPELDREDVDPETYYLIAEDTDVTGIIPRQWALAHTGALTGADTLADVAQDDFIVVTRGQTIFDLLAELQHEKASVAVIVEDKSAQSRTVVGVVTKGNVADAIAEAMLLFED